MQKNGPPNFPRGKVRNSIEKIDLLAYSIFKNIEISSGQGVVQIKPNSVWSIPCVGRAEAKQNF